MKEGRNKRTRLEASRDGWDRFLGTVERKAEREEGGKGGRTERREERRKGGWAERGRKEVQKKRREEGEKKRRKFGRKVVHRKQKGQEGRRA